MDPVPRSIDADATSIQDWWRWSPSALLLGRDVGCRVSIPGERAGKHAGSNGLERTDTHHTWSPLWPRREMVGGRRTNPKGHSRGRSRIVSARRSASGGVSSVGVARDTTSTDRGGNLKGCMASVQRAGAQHKVRRCPPMQPNARKYRPAVLRSLRQKCCWEELTTPVTAPRQTGVHSQGVPAYHWSFLSQRVKVWLSGRWKDMFTNSVRG